MLLQKLAGKLAAATAKLLPRELRAKSKPDFDLRWPLVGRFDVLGHPVAVFRVPDGREVALDYATYSRSANRAASPVPVEWVRAFGTPIDAPRYDGLLMARCVGSRAPMVAQGADGTIVIVTIKGALTRRIRAPGGPRWLRGVHVPVDELRRMRRVVGEPARALVADSQSPGAFLTVKQWGELLARTMCEGRNHHVMERYGGIHEGNLPGLPPWGGYSDDAIEQSKRAAAELIDRIAAPMLTDVVKLGAGRPASRGPPPRP